MKAKHMLAVFFLLMGIVNSLLSYDYFIESLESIVRKATHIVEAEVTEIEQSIDEHKTPVQIVTLKLTDVIVGKSISPVIALQFMTDYESEKRLLNPKFKVGERVIVNLKEYADGGYTVLGHDQGKYEITGSTIEGSAISVKHFKQQIKDVYEGKSNLIDIPEHRKTSDMDYDGDGIPKLDGEFHLLYPPGWADFGYYPISHQPG